MTEPFVVTGAPGVPGRLLRLADVIIIEPDRLDQLAALLADCPGVTLILVGTGLPRSVAVAAYQVWIGQFGP
jgi:hypothetical protein